MARVRHRPFAHPLLGLALAITDAVLATWLLLVGRLAAASTE